MTSLLELFFLVQEVRAPLRKRLSFRRRHIWHTERPSKRGYCRCIIGRFIGFRSLLGHPYFLWCLSAVTPSEQAVSPSTRFAAADQQGQHDAEERASQSRNSRNVPTRQSTAGSREHGLYKSQRAASDTHLLLLYNPYHLIDVSPLKVQSY
jgi:hypothetical protein